MKIIQKQPVPLGMCLYVFGTCPTHVWNFNLCWVRFLHAQFESCPWVGSEGPQFFFQMQIVTNIAHAVTFYNFLSTLFGQRNLEGPLQAVEMTAPGDAAQRVVLQEALVAASGSQTKSTKLSPIVKLNSEVVWWILFVVFQICVICLKGPPRERDALVLRAQFSIGDRVEYRSDTHRQWLPGTVSEPLCVFCFFVHWVFQF